MYTEYKDIQVTCKDRVATLLLNRADVNNTFTPGIKAEFRDAMAKLSEDDDVGVVVITGAGKNFSAGGNINNMKKNIEAGTTWTEDQIIKGSTLSFAVRECKKPVIAMVNGAAAGAGASICFACDFRFVAPKTRFIMSFINLGITGDCGGMYYLERLVGLGKMTEIMMCGTPLTGPEAAGFGMARLVEDEGALESETYQFAQKLAHGPTVAYGLQKATMNAAFFHNYHDQFAQREAAGMAISGRTEDFKEAVYAFLEKRKPNFQGK